MIRKTIAIAVLAVLAALACPVLMAQTMYWQSSFGSIALPDIAIVGGTSEGSSATTLLLTGDAELSADNSATAQLSEAGGDFLVTEYGLEFDKTGLTGSGAPPVAYTPYDTFLATPAYITHKKNDDDVVVTLTVRASMSAGEAANAAVYTATQTITVTWIGP